MERLSGHERRLTSAGRSHRTVISKQGTRLLVEVDGVPHRVSHDEAGIVRSHAPGVVVSIPVAEGDEVSAGDVMAVLESMKMESSLTAPRAGRVRQVLVGPNTQVGSACAAGSDRRARRRTGSGGRPRRLPSGGPRASRHTGALR